MCALTIEVLLEERDLEGSDQGGEQKDHSHPQTPVAHLQTETMAGAGWQRLLTANGTQQDWCPLHQGNP